MSKNKVLRRFDDGGILLIDSGPVIIKVNPKLKVLTKYSVRGQIALSHNNSGRKVIVNPISRPGQCV
jgi:hypothetical protein